MSPRRKTEDAADYAAITAGFAAGSAAVSTEDNPYAPGSRLALLWERNRLRGVALAAEPALFEPPPAVSFIARSCPED